MCMAHAHDMRPLLSKQMNISHFTFLIIIFEWYTVSNKYCTIYTTCRHGKDEWFVTPPAATGYYCTLPVNNIFYLRPNKNVA